MSRARDNANLSPTIADARMPNLTGDVTTVEGAVATTIATDAVDIAMLSATGTASSSTFLRGDNSWQTAGSTSASDLDSGTLPLARLADHGPLSHRNMIINGGMQVWQRATAATVATSIYDTVDRWKFNEGFSSASFTSELHTMSVAELNTTGHRTALKLLCVNDEGTIDAGEHAYFNTKLEGQDCQRLQYGTANAKDITVSFWVKSNKTGTYNISLYTAGATAYQVSKNYTIVSADTWEQKKITITPTEGSTSLITSSPALLANDNTQALLLYFGLAWASNISSTAVDTWVAAGTAYGNSSQTNWMDSATSPQNNFYITGIQMELGSNATPFEHRTYGDELARCQRYFVDVINKDQRYDFGGWGSNKTTTKIRFMVPLNVPLRAIPTAPSAGTLYSWTIDGEETFTSPTVAGSQAIGGQSLLMEKDGVSVSTLGSSGQVAGESSGAYLWLDAEL